MTDVANTRASDPSPSRLMANELVARLREVGWERGDGGSPDVLIDDVAMALAPLLAERDAALAEVSAARDRAVAAYNRLDKDWAARRDEARVLREALERAIAFARIAGPANDPATWHHLIVRYDREWYDSSGFKWPEWLGDEPAALASSSVTEPETVATIDASEHAEALADPAMRAALDEAGRQLRERRASSLRELLTSAPAVEALRGYFHTSITPRDAKGALAAVADHLTREEGAHG